MKENKAIVQNQMACVSFPLPVPLPAPGSHPLKEREGQGCVLPGAAATPPGVGPPAPLPVKRQELVATGLAFVFHSAA